MVTELFALEQHGPDTYVGESPAYEWGRIYGGLVVAQALKAAALTVDSDHGIHSLHAYFILGGDPKEPVRYEVDRLRNGRSFTTRQVVARQSGGAILNLSASFQRDEDGPNIQTPQMPKVPKPGELDTDRNIPGRETRTVSHDHDPPQSRQWVRFDQPIDNELDHICALAYLTDSNAIRAIRAGHPKAHDTNPNEHHKHFMGASLDHAVWFHRPVKADDWLLLDMRSLGMIGSRGLAMGWVLDQQGTHVATIAQEGLLRERKRK